MQRSLERGELYYDKVYGYIGFYVRSAHGELDSYYGCAASYCPYCGAKLHKNLHFEYDDELEKAVGKEYCDIKPEDIPEEFKTDEWWKKRGL